MAIKVITFKRLATFAATLLLSFILVGFGSGSIQKEAARNLDWAVRNNKLGYARFLLLAGTDSNAKVEAMFICGNDTSGIVDYWRPLHSAALEGTSEGVRLLLDHGAQVNATDRFGRTAIWNSALGGNADVARLLIERGAIVNAAPVSIDGMVGETAIEEAAEGGETEVLEVLVENGAGDQQSLNSALWHAVWHNHPEAARFLLDKGADANFDKSSDGQSLLHIAKAQEDAAELVAVLRQAGAED
ncbi:MAG TPA: ankyrin repeat domain-containing protein [Pyrinomonadaceae bacterium]|nr:ankyrin repeat domain-containing protein [Pyrinomonadaceae bacterium]